MVFNATFNNISIKSWWSVLLLEETGENHQPVASHWQTISHNVVSNTLRHEHDWVSQPLIKINCQLKLNLHLSLLEMYTI